MKKQYLIFYYNGHSIDIDLNFLNLNKINKQIFLIICSLLFLLRNFWVNLEIIFNGIFSKRI